MYAINLHVKWVVKKKFKVWFTLKYIKKGKSNDYDEMDKILSVLIRNFVFELLSL